MSIFKGPEPKKQEPEKVKKEKKEDHSQQSKEKKQNIPENKKKEINIPKQEEKIVQPKDDITPINKEVPTTTERNDQKLLNDRIESFQTEDPAAKKPIVNLTKEETIPKVEEKIEPQPTNEVIENRIPITKSSKDQIIEESPQKKEDELPKDNPHASQPKRKKVVRENHNPIIEEPIVVFPPETNESQPKLTEEYEVKELKPKENKNIASQDEIKTTQPSEIIKDKPFVQNAGPSEIDEEKKVIAESLQSGPVVMFFSILNYWQLIVGILIGFLLGRLLSR